MTPAAPSASQLSVGGSYAVAVALGANSCGPVTVQSQPTSVSQAPGASSFVLVHGSNSFAGTLGPGASFTTAPLTLNDAGSVLAVTLQGRFTTTGLTATATVDVQPPAPAGTCRYLVDWVGTKQGVPNVIP